MKFNSLKHLLLWILTITLSAGGGYLFLEKSYKQATILEKTSPNSRLWQDYDKILREKRSKEIIELAKSYFNEKSLTLKEEFYTIKVDSVDYILSSDNLAEFYQTDSLKKISKYAPLEPYALTSNSPVKVLGYKINAESLESLVLEDILMDIQIESTRLHMNLVQFEKTFIFNGDESLVEKSKKRFLSKKRNYPINGYLCYNKVINNYTKKEMVVGENDKYINFMKSQSQKLSKIIGSSILKEETEKSFDLCYLVSLSSEVDYLALELNRRYHFKNFFFKALNE